MPRKELPITATRTKLDSVIDDVNTPLAMYVPNTRKWDSDMDNQPNDGGYLVVEVEVEALADEIKIQKILNCFISFCRKVQELKEDGKIRVTAAWTIDLQSTSFRISFCK